MIMWNDPRIQASPKSARKFSTTRAYTDLCVHGDAAFIGSIRYYRKKGLTATELVDVYVWKTRGERIVCVRYGDRPQQCLNMGSPMDVIAAAIRQGESARLAEAVAALLVDTFRITLVRRKRPA